MNLKFWKTKNEVKKSYTLGAGGGWTDFFTKKDDFSKWETSWVNTAVSVRAENLASAKVTMHRKKGKESVEVSENPFLELVNGTNSYQQSWFELMYLVSLSLDINGKAFLYAVPGVKKLPAELRFLPACNMKVILNEAKTEIAHYEFLNLGGKTTFAVEEIIYFKLPNTGNPFDGLPTIKSCENVIEIDNIQSMFQKKFTLTGGNINEVLTNSAEGSASDEEMERLDEKMREKNEVDSNSSWLILDGWNYERIKASARDLDFINGKIQTASEILKKLRVPEIILGGNSANYATAKMQLNSFIENTIKPFSKFIVDKLNIFIRKTYGKEFYIMFEWNTSDPRDDKELYDMLIRNGVVDPDEIREIYGFGQRPKVEF